MGESPGVARGHVLPPVARRFAHHGFLVSPSWRIGPGRSVAPAIRRFRLAAAGYPRPPMSPLLPLTPKRGFSLGRSGGVAARPAGSPVQALAAFPDLRCWRSPASFTR